MKIIIFSVIGLALGTLGGTAVGGMKGKATLLAEMEAEKVAQESTHEAERTEGPAAPGSSQAEEGVHGTEDPTDPPPKDPTPARQPEETHQEAPRGIDASQAIPNTPQEPIVGGSTALEQDTVPPTEENEGAARLAKIFGSMKAPEAAKVLQNLDDEELKAILFHLTDRKAGEILGNFEPERAAKLSRAVLGSPGGEGL